MAHANFGTALPSASVPGPKEGENNATAAHKVEEEGLALGEQRHQAVAVELANLRSKARACQLHACRVVGGVEQPLQGVEGESSGNAPPSPTGPSANVYVQGHRCSCARWISRAPTDGTPSKPRTHLGRS